MRLPASPACLSIGFILMPDFTMLALAGFIDTLRLAADEGDRSRQIDCRWSVMTSDGDPVRASNGVRIVPDHGLVDPGGLDYLVVVGGVMRRGPELDPALGAYLADAARRRIPLVGICTGGFVLARAGLMSGRKCCISWFHKSDLEIEFPDLKVVADQLFVVDHDRITCAGGTSVIHLASHLVEKHVGAGRSAKGLRVMLEDRIRLASSPQPLPALPGLDGVSDARVRRAMLMIERDLMAPQPLSTLAASLGASVRQLNRLFKASVGETPSAFREALRLERAEVLVRTTDLTLTEIALRCGFADGSHFSRRFKRRYGCPPGASRLASSRKSVIPSGAARQSRALACGAPRA